MDFKDCIAPVADDMRAVDTLIRDRLHSDVVLINQISAHIIGSGGKRLRPILALMAARAHGDTTDKPVLLAAIIEFIHTATLLHDDVVDETERRRGQPTANANWGNPGAVLSGDFLYSRSFQLMVEADDMRLMRELADTTNAIAEGEVLQLMACGNPDTDEAAYLEVIERKTARLFRAATRLGAMLAGGDEAVQQAARDYGHNLGMAFQIVDDLLDYLADPQVSGKNLGTDLAEGKPTLPLIRAMQVGGSTEQRLLRSAIADGGSDDIESVLRAVESTDAIHYTSAAAQRYASAAQSALAHVPPSDYRTAMSQLADFTVSRTL
ncbi:polyprenyl synthetase family protein [Algiphilus sp.]|uniref:polyprenyl synthetase family protein n=1 Tax=Algiphilus sp. TaxID=1872431 RepID=UPI0032F0312C